MKSKKKTITFSKKSKKYKPIKSKKRSNNAKKRQRVLRTRNKKNQRMKNMKNIEKAGAKGTRGKHDYIPLPEPEPEPLNPYDSQTEDEDEEEHIPFFEPEPEPEQIKRPAPKVKQRPTKTKIKTSTLKNDVLMRMDHYERLDLTKYHPILGDNKTGSFLKDLKKNFRGAALQVHPDKSEEKESVEKFQLFSDSYSVLNDTDEREAHDREILAASERELSWYDYINPDSSNLRPAPAQDMNRGGHPDRGRSRTRSPHWSFQEGPGQETQGPGQGPPEGMSQEDWVDWVNFEKRSAALEKRRDEINGTGDPFFLDEKHIRSIERANRWLKCQAPYGYPRDGVIAELLRRGDFNAETFLEKAGLKSNEMKKRRQEFGRLVSEFISNLKRGETGTDISKEEAERYVKSNLFMDENPQILSRMGIDERLIHNYRIDKADARIKRITTTSPNCCARQACCVGCGCALGLLASSDPVSSAILSHLPADCADCADPTSVTGCNEGQLMMGADACSAGSFGCIIDDGHCESEATACCVNSTSCLEEHRIPNTHAHGSHNYPRGYAAHHACQSCRTAFCERCSAEEDDM